LNVPAPSIRFASDQSLLVSWPGPPSIETNAWVLKLFRLLKGAAHVENLHPAYSSLLIDSGRRADPAALADFVRGQISKISYGEPAVGAVREIPVRYDGEDLDEVARQAGISTEEVIRLHADGEYRVSFLGFAPGFPYLMGLREKLFCRRKESPRLKVPAGSVAIAGFQTGIYPSESPGGWQLIGRTSLELFDPHRDPPCLLEPGERIRFKEQREPRPRPQKKTTVRHWKGHELFEVLDAGFYSTIQDRGRFQFAHLGVSRGGAADPLALNVGNQILGNDPSAAAVEMTMRGMSVRFLKDAWIALTGAPGDFALDGRAMGMWSAVQVSAGQSLSAGALKKPRAYLCVRGGIGAEVLLGGRATAPGGWGGFEGRALAKGDVLHEEEDGASPPSHRPRSLVLERMYAERIRVLRATRGPQWDFFADGARTAFFDSEFEVTSEADRLGLRLSGPFLEYAAGFRETELISEGIPNGAIQVPASGAPMILFCDQTTTGGYPKIANVIHADLFRLGQLKPGDKFRFKEVTREEARRFSLELEEALQGMGFLS
jgi:KipI family sensor histidine kinase inhibitor